MEHPIAAPPSPGPPPSPSGPLRNGSIIKNHRRTPSFVKSASTGYRMRERSGPSQGKWIFIVNGTKLKQWEELCPRLLKQLSSVDWKVYITKYPGHARKLAEKAALGNADLVAAIGGDGTLNEVVDGVMKAGVYGEDGLPRAVVTILPIGTASDFHRSMAWEPNNFEEAMWRIGKRGSTAILDVARVQCASPYGPQDRYFINVASCGASARAALGLDGYRWMGEKSAYRMAAIAALFKYNQKTLAVRIDDGEWDKIRGTTMLAIGNGSYFGNGLNIAPDANPYDGRLQVVTARHMGVFDFLFKSWRLRMGKHLDLKGFSSQNASKIDVAIWGKSLDMNAYTVVPGAGSGGGTMSRTASADAVHPLQNGGTRAGLPHQQQSDIDSDDEGGDVTVTPRQQSANSIVFDREASMDMYTAGNNNNNNNMGAGWTTGSQSSSRPPSDGGSSRSRSTVSAYQQHLQQLQQQKEAQEKQKKVKKDKVDYGAVPLEIDGEVIGHAPFTVIVIPGALKFRVAGVPH